MKNLHIPDAARRSICPHKAPTYIQGLDEILNGGLPAGRATVICGGPGCGKTTLALEFVGRGAQKGGEKGLYVSFEEPAESVISDFAALNFDLAGLVESGGVRIECIHLKPRDLAEAGQFTLEGLSVRLENWLQSGAIKRVAIDGLDSLFLQASRAQNLRFEIWRILDRLRERNITTLITAERSSDRLTRHGFEEFVSDCVILLDHRVTRQITKRRLRILKYRGSSHGNDEYPFLITETGIKLLPVTSMSLEGPASETYVTTGIRGLDRALGGRGVFQGSTVLISGSTGAGKTTVLASFAAALCSGGKRCLFFSFEESESQLCRDMKSVGIALQRHVQNGNLLILPLRPTAFGLEEHLFRMELMVEENKPDAVVVDQISTFQAIGKDGDIRAMLLRMLDYFQVRGITVFMASVSTLPQRAVETEATISSVVDVWILLTFLKSGGVRHRVLTVKKARGLDHSLGRSRLILQSQGPELIQDSVSGTSGGKVGG